MNGYDLTRMWLNFRFENPHKCRAVHSELYMYICDLWNRLGQKEKFGLPTEMTMELLGIGSYNTYNKAYTDLVKWGFIKEIKKSKNQYSSRIIALSKIDKATDKALDKATIKATDDATVAYINNKQINNKQITSSKEEEEQAPEYGKDYINNFNSTVHKIYSKHGLVINLSNRKYSSQWVNKNGIAKTKIEAIKGLGYNDIYKFIEDIVVKAKQIKYGNYVDKITDLYKLWKNYASIINLTKKEEKALNTNQSPQGVVGWEVYLKSLVGISMQETEKLNVSIKFCNFIRSIKDKETKEKRLQLRGLAIESFGEGIYKKGWEATKKEIILPTR